MRPLLLALLGLTGCDAQIVRPGGIIGGTGGFGAGSGSGAGGSGAGSGSGSGGAGEVNPCESNPLTVGTAPMRRLSHEEYRNSLSDLQPTWTAVVNTQVQTLSKDTDALGFRNGAEFLDVKLLLANQYMAAAEAIAAQAVTNLPALLPCTPTGNEAGCADQFIRAFGRKLYRRPLATEEVARYVTVYGNARTAGYDFKTGIEWVVFTFLNSPGFLYRVELDAPGSSGLRSLTGLELASRLSYLLWQSAPDETLLAAAESGQLSTPADVDVQARRMLSDPKSRRLIDFVEQWMQWGKLDQMTRGAAVFPGLPTNLGQLFKTEARQFAENTIFDGDHKLSTLLTGNYTFVNQTLAQHYGFAGVTGNQFQRVATPGRGGLLMLGANAGTHDLSNRTSIVHRGVAIRTMVMCQVVPAAPPNVPALGPIDPQVSQAQRLALHRSDPGCAACHSLIDGLGSPLESVDAVGRIRTVDEAGNALDTRGEINRSRDISGPVADTQDLINKLGSSGEVRDCFATQLYRFSMGRKEETADACSTYTLKKAFERSGGNIHEALLTLTQLEDFNRRQVVQP